MSLDKKHITDLLEKFAKREATPEEINQLYAFIKNDSSDESIVGFIQSQLEGFDPKNAEDIDFWATRLEGVAQKIAGGSFNMAVAPADQPRNDVDRIPAVHRVHFLRRWGWAAAAVLIAGSAVYLWNLDRGNSRSGAAKHPPASSSRDRRGR